MKLVVSKGFYNIPSGFCFFFGLMEKSKNINYFQVLPFFDFPVDKNTFLNLGDG